MRNTESEDVPTRKVNRWKSKRPRKGMFWCWKCDRETVGVGEKCPACGAEPRQPGVRKSNEPI